MRLLVTLLLASVAAGCTSELPTLVGADESAIVSGTVDAGHPSVGYLLTNGTGLCTATLIGKKTVLTASHCIGTTHVFTLGGATYAVTKTVRHPNWDPYYLTNDIAVVLLADAPPTAPTPISTTAPSVGLAITLVGYGVTGEGLVDSGTKRIAQNKISSMKATVFSFTGAGGGMGSTCYGDSGGPAFATLKGVEVQIGVTSNGAKPCGTLANDTRVDAFAGWIAQTAGGDVVTGDTASDTSPPSVAITSPAAGATVPGDTTVEASVSDNVKVVKVELLVDGVSSGTLPAAPWRFSVTLKDGAHSLTINGFDAAGNKGAASVTVTVGTSQPVDPTQPGTFGAGCGGPQDCQSGLCAADAAGSYCTMTCDTAGAPCPLGAACLPTSDGARFVCGAPMHNLPADDTGQSGVAGGQALTGGCSVGGSSPAALLPSLMLLLAAAISWRRWPRRPAPR